MPENKHYIELLESVFPDAIVALTPDEVDTQRLEYVPKSKIDDLLSANQAWQAENAKLKELARGYESLTAALCDERGCDGCPFDSELPVCEHMRLVACLGELGADE